MSMTNEEAFSARLVRIRNGAPNTKGTIFVGQDEQHHLTRDMPQKQSKGKEVASNSLYPLSLLGAFALGLFGAALGIYARFHLMTGKDGLTEDADLEMALSGGVGLMLAFVLAQIFRLTSKEHRGLQGVGVFVMICGFHNFAFWAPAPMAALFSPAYVAAIQIDAPPNSAKFRGVYFPIFDTGTTTTALADDPDATAATAADCPPAGGTEVVLLQTDNAKKVKKSGHKTVAAVKSDGTACATP